MSAGLAASTVTPGSTAPDASRTVPASVCADATFAVHSNAAAAANREILSVVMRALSGTPDRERRLYRVHIYRCRAGAGEATAKLSFEVDVLGQTRAPKAELVTHALNPASGLDQIDAPEIEVQHVDEPRSLVGAFDVGIDDLTRDRKRRLLRVVVHVAIARPLELRVLLVEQTRKHRSIEPTLRQRGSFVQPFPEDAHTDLAGGHVLHQVEHIVIAEGIPGVFNPRPQNPRGPA